MGQVTEMYERKKSDKIWEWILRASVPVVLTVSASQINDQIRISRNENNIEHLQKGGDLHQVRQDIRTLLDRTARIETKVENIERVAR